MSKKTDYKLKNEAFLVDKKQQEGVHELPKGVLYEIQKSGNPQGRRPDLRSVVCVHYTGRLINGRVFDDSRRDGIPAASLAALLDRLAVRDALPKSILYTLNASDNEKLIAAAGCFHDGATAGKVQFGSAWWFNDHLDGMEKQLRNLANIGVLSRFVGMLTDSRSFLSYPRHEYFRRILCRVIGGWVADGQAPADYELLGAMVQDICFHNVANFIGIQG